jgi:hypothetical protein
LMPLQAAALEIVSSLFSHPSCERNFCELVGYTEVAEKSDWPGGIFLIAKEPRRQVGNDSRG